MDAGMQQSAEPGAVEVLADAVRPFYDAACACDPESPECAMAVDEDCALEVLYSYRDQLGSRYRSCAAALETATGCLSECASGCTGAAELLPCAFYLVEPLSSQLGACLRAP
jgi:hypothetical protein